jgi:hypothetical protein
MYCSKCGAQIPDDSVFCPNCGTPVGGAAGSTGYGPDLNSGKKGTGCWIAIIIAGVIVIPLIIISVLAAVALPAYSKYTARAKFTEVTTAAGPLKQQVELCYFDLGTLDGCSDDRSGTGWNLARAVKETQSKYVLGAEVKDGVIAMYSQNIMVGGEKVFTEILVPYPNYSSGDTALSWKIAPESTCKEKDLC